MPKKAYLAEHLSSEELKDRYRRSQDSVETRRWHLLWKISLGWTIKNAAVAISCFDNLTNIFVCVLFGAMSE